MNKLIPAFLTKLDSWLLLNYPRVWATRVHYLVAVLLVGSVVAGLAAFVPSVQVMSMHSHSAFSLNDSLARAFFAVIALPILVYWLIQFRAKHYVFSWKEVYLSLFFCTSITALFYFFINIYSVVYQVRTSNLIPKQEIEKDLILTKLINEIIYSRVNKFEDVKVQNYVLTKEESVRLYQNVNYFSTLSDAKLGGYIDTREEELSELTDTVRAIKERELDSLFKAFHFKAVEKCTEVPDSLKVIYFKLSNNKKRLPDLSYDYLPYHLTKISPTSKYLFDKYKIKEFVRIEVNGEDTYEGNGGISHLLENLESYFGLQQTHLLERFLEKRSFSFPFIAEEHIEDKEGDSIALFTVSNKRTLELNQNLQDFKTEYRFWNTLLLLCTLLFFPFLALCVIIHFRRNDILFAALSLIVPFTLNLLGYGFLGNAIETDTRHYIVCAQFVVIQLLVFFFYWKRSALQNKFIQIFLPFALAASLICIPFINNLLEIWQYKSFNENQLLYALPNNYIRELYFGYTILILPLIFLLYHRLSHLPKHK